MNRLQITILWIVLTALLPAAYFVISRGFQIERRLNDNFAIRQKTTDTNKHTYLITTEKNGKPLTYEVETNHYPTADDEILKLVAGGRLLSDREAKAWDEKDSVEHERRRFWELSASGFFVITSVTGLLLYRAKVNSRPATGPL